MPSIRANGSISPLGSGGTPQATGTQPTAIALSPIGPRSSLPIQVITRSAFTPLILTGAWRQRGHPQAPAIFPLQWPWIPHTTYSFVADRGSDSIMVFSIGIVPPSLSNETLVSEIFLSYPDSCGPGRQRACSSCHHSHELSMR